MFTHAAYRTKLTLIILFACAVTVAAEDRNWTDSTGKFSVIADLVVVKDGKATLKKPNGKTITLPLMRLSKADHEYAKQWKAAIDASDNYPSLPGAMTEPPGWLANDPNVPFDLEAFFQAPPPEENAAPLYLLALGEFDFSCAFLVRGIDPEKEPEKAKQLYDRLEARNDAFDNLLEQYWTFEDDPNAAKEPTPNAMAKVLEPFQPALDLLAKAQQKPQCVFEPERTFDALIFHIHAARTPARVLKISARRFLKLGDIDSAIDCVEPVLRLSRDLRPRGNELSQIVANALEKMAAADPLHDEGLTDFILAAPDLTTEHCDKLLAILKRHQSTRIDGFVDTCCADYIASRGIIRELQEGVYQRVMRERGYEAPRTGFTPITYLSTVCQMRDTTLLEQHPLLRRFKDKQDPEQAQTVMEYHRRITSMKDADYEREIQALNECYTSLKSMAKFSNRRRAEGISIAVRPLINTDIAIWLKPEVSDLYLQSEMRADVILGGTECLVALRRWQLNKGELPTNLKSALNEAGIDEIPVDSFNGRRLRMTTNGGQPAVYSIGPDGKDDGGRVKYDHKLKKGDYVFRLPAAGSAR